MTACDLWDYDTWRRRWERTHLAEQEAYSRPKKVRRARSGEVVTALKEWFGAGDPRLVAFIEVLKETGFDRQNAKTRQRVHAKPIEYNCVRRMEQLLLRGRAQTFRIAAARVAVEFAVEGNSFKAVVKRLEGAHRAHRDRQGAAP